MTVKEKIVDIFEHNKGRFLSGEELGEKIGCTRGSVWKAVKLLQNDGYDIVSVTNKGYCLLENNDVISEEGIKSFLKDNTVPFDFHVFKSIDSTNIKMKELASDGAPEWTVVISGEQTKGRGRLGRSFFSPSDTGIYITILLRPQMSAEDAIKITTAAAVAVAEAVEEVSDKKADIKWVNDVYLSGKKACGILTEAAFGLEYGGMEYVFSGIGVNVYKPQNDFPDDIKNTAGYVFSERESNMRNRIAAEILTRFAKYYKDIENSSYFDGYEKRLLWKGEKINIISPSGTTPATLEGVDKNCRLIVSYDDGKEGIVSSGEISIRKA